MQKVKVWDPLVRIFHWSLVALFLFNALLSNPDSKLHRQIGYVVAALIGFRILWGFVGTRHARFRDFRPSLSGCVEQLTDLATGRTRIHKGHTPLGALMIYNLLLTIGGIAITGYMMTTLRFWGVEWVEELHEILVSFAEISVVAHVVAVIWESKRTKVNLPRAMVTGTKLIPNGRQE